MTITETNLFIGGTMDGQRRDNPIGNDCSHLKIPIVSAPDEIAHDDALFLKTGYELYRRERLATREKSWCVWILAGMPTEDAMGRLLECYRPESAVTP